MTEDKIPKEELENKVRYRDIAGFDDYCAMGCG